MNGSPEAQAKILTVPHTGTWGWRLTLDDLAVATSSRGYSRHRECVYNVSAFVAAAAIAELTDAELPRTVATDRGAGRRCNAISEGGLMTIAPPMIDITDAEEPPPSAAGARLDAERVSAWFGTNKVLDRVSLSMPPGTG